MASSTLIAEKTALRFCRAILLCGSLREAASGCCHPSLQKEPADGSKRSSIDDWRLTTDHGQTLTFQHAHSIVGKEVER
jgi:hypothetical protein